MAPSQKKLAQPGASLLWQLAHLGEGAGLKLSSVARLDVPLVAPPRPILRDVNPVRAVVLEAGEEAVGAGDPVGDKENDECQLDEFEVLRRAGRRGRSKRQARQAWSASTKERIACK